jgi:hypothetical protein
MTKFPAPLLTRNEQICIISPSQHDAKHPGHDCHCGNTLPALVLQNYVMNELQGVPNVIVTAMTVLQQGSGKVENDPTAAASDAAGSKPDQHATPTAAKSTPPSTPAGRQQGQGHSTPAAAAAGGARSLLTPGPIPSPSEE